MPSCWKPGATDRPRRAGRATSRLLQIDPTAAVAPNADLVRGAGSGRPTTRPSWSPRSRSAGWSSCWGWSGRPRTSRSSAPRWRVAGPRRLLPVAGRQRGWVDANDGAAPTCSPASPGRPATVACLPDTCEVPWRSLGLERPPNVPELLNLMVRAARSPCRAVGARAALGPRRAGLPRRSGARGGRPADPRRTPAPGPRHRPGEVGQGPDGAERRGAGRRGGRGRGRQGFWRVDPTYLDAPVRGTRGAALAVRPAGHDRRRMAELFEFDYQLEMYKPEARRRWGYFALPVLHGDRLVGKLDATADRRHGVLRVHAAARGRALQRRRRRRRPRRGRGARPLARARAGRDPALTGSPTSVSGARVPARRTPPPRPLRLRPHR